MTTKQILLSTLILTTIANITLGMDNTAKNKNLEEEIFQTNIAQLTNPLQILSWILKHGQKRSKIK